jgi:DNA-binding NarL/FixJ family response regulator
MKDLSVLLLDHNPLFAQLLTRFLQMEEKVRVTVMTTREGQVLENTEELAPEVVLVDLDKSVKTSLDMIARIRRLLPDALIITMTMMETVYYRKAVQDAGADELVVKQDLNSNFLIYMHSLIEKKMLAKARSQSVIVPNFAISC